MRHSLTFKSLVVGQHTIYPSMRQRRGLKLPRVLHLLPKWATTSRYSCVRTASVGCVDTWTKRHQTEIQMERFERWNWVGMRYFLRESRPSEQSSHICRRLLQSSTALQLTFPWHGCSSAFILVDPSASRASPPIPSISAKLL